VCKREGVFFPWAAPFENIDGFEVNGPTNADTYQFHNAAYVFAMVWESFLVSRDENFLSRHFGLLEGVVRFYNANTELPEQGGAIFRNDDVPLRSQDEGTPRGALTVQPLCSVWSSLYTFRAWLEACRILNRGDAKLRARVETILERGYDFGPLRRDDGTLRTSATDSREHGRQKHPIQLTPLTWLPLADWMDDPGVVASWRHRHYLCKLTRVPTSLGWTIAHFIFASARMRDGAAVQHDLALVQRARYADPEWIQFYECSNRWGWTARLAYYFVTIEVVAKAMLECVVQDCRDAIEFFPAILPRWEGRPLAFQRLHLRGGLIARGRLDGSGYRIGLHATRDADDKIRVLRPQPGVLKGPGIEQAFAGGETVRLRLATGQTAEILSEDTA
jgi:hypothetical protein